MKKASNYVLLAGIIYSFVVVVALCVVAFIFLSCNTPDGKQAIKKCFWLNASYIKKQIEESED